MFFEPHTTLTWAWQLHYYLCFRTRRRRPFFERRQDELQAVLEEICLNHDYHLLKAQVYSDHLRCLVSLKPADDVASVIRILKANSARLLSPGESLWERGYLARSTGRVRLAAVKQYLQNQAEHHGYAARLRPPIYNYRTEAPIALTAAHASFELNHHLVFSTSYRRGVFGASLGKSLSQYWLHVAQKRGFAVDRISVVPDHVHLLVRIPPKMSIEACALTLLNNGQFFVSKHEPQALIAAGVDSLWQPSAYAGTCGEMTTALVKAFLSN